MKTITYKYENGKHQLTPQSKADLTAMMLEPKDLLFKQISKSEARSLEQLKLYWGAILPTVAHYIDQLSDFVTIDDKGRQHYEALHRYLTLRFCLDNGRDDLMTLYRTKVSGSWLDVPICHFSIDKMKVKDANEYLDWLNTRFQRKVGLTIEQAIEKKTMHEC